MKIGLVVDDTMDKVDGVQQYVARLGQWFAAKGHEVHYLTSDSRRQDLPNIHSLSRTIQVKFNHNRLGTPLPASRRRIRQLLDAGKFDVLHVQLPYSPWLAGRVIKSADAKTAVFGTFHVLPYSWLEKTATKLLGLMVRRSKQRLDRVFSVSPAAAEFADSSLGVSSSVLPNPIDVSSFRKGKPTKRPAGKSVHIVFLGRLVERKGCRQFIKALIHLHRAGDLVDVAVSICGDGGQAAELKKLVKQNGLHKIVKFKGFIKESEKADYMASADIAVMPSISGESFGIVLIEGMAGGASVVIGGDNPGYRSVLGEHPEQLVDPRDTAAFATTLKRFIDNPKDRAAAKRWQLASVKQYDIAVVGRALLQEYRQVIAKRAKNSDNVTKQ